MSKQNFFPSWPPLSTTAKIDKQRNDCTALNRFYSLQFIFSYPPPLSTKAKANIKEGKIWPWPWHQKRTSRSMSWPWKALANLIHKSMVHSQRWNLQLLMICSFQRQECINFLAWENQNKDHIIMGASHYMLQKQLTPNPAFRYCIRLSSHTLINSFFPPHIFKVLYRGRSQNCQNLNFLHLVDET